MFGTKEKVVEPVVVEKQPEPKYISKSQEDYDLAKSLGLEKQMQIIKFEDRGYKAIRRADLHKLLDVKADVLLDAARICHFEGKVPFSVMCKYRDLLEENIFNYLYIVAPLSYSPDPLLIGEKRTYLDINRGSSGPNGFWHRDSVLILIARWNTEKEKETSI